MLQEQGKARSGTKAKNNAHHNIAGFLGSDWSHGQVCRFHQPKVGLGNLISDICLFYLGEECIVDFSVRLYLPLENGVLEIITIYINGIS